MEDAYDSIVALTEFCFISRGYHIVDSYNEGFELVYQIQPKNPEQKSIEFCFRNLLLDIATVDRDAEVLQFDAELEDLEYNARKVASIVFSRIEALEMLTQTGDLDKLNDKGERHE